MLPLLTGLLLAISFPPSPLGVLSLVAYVPLTISILRDGLSWGRWKRLGMLYLPFFIYHLASNWWISSWQEHTDPYLFASGIALDVVHPLFLLLPWYLLASLRNRLGPIENDSSVVLALLPLFISGFEWLHGQGDASYPWLTSGYMLVYTPFAQIADYIGVYGLSFMIGVVNALIALAVVRKKRRLGLVLAFSVIAVWFALGLINEQYESKYTNRRSINVALIQPNENPWDKWSDPRIQLWNHTGIVDSVRQQFNQVFQKSNHRPLIVWSETAIPYTIRQPAHANDFAKLRQWVDTSNIVLLTGYADLMTYAPGTAPPSARRSSFDSTVRYDAFNAAMVLWPSIGDIPVHRKTILTPVAERLPFADQLTFAMSWIEWGVGISAWGKGRERTPLPVDVDGIPISGANTTADTAASVGVIVCIESIYPEMVRDLVNNGADLLCIITNDAWYNGTTGPGQHFDIARMRAIEQRRTVIRCANSGITGAIDATGRTIKTIPPMTKGSCNVSVRTSSRRTVYASLGDVLPPAALFVAVLAFILARFPSLIRKLPIR